MYTLTPCLNGSVFDCFKKSCNRRGFALLSTATSRSDKWQEGSYKPLAGIVNSLTRKKPKNAVQHIAQNVVLSNEGAFLNSTILILCKILMMIGNRGFEKHFPAWRFLIPLSTKRSRGVIW